VAEDFQSLLEKFEDNKALSKETLEKMERIRELMEDISNEQLQEALEKLRESMEQLDPDVLRKAMEDFKFSMEDFAEKLEQTIQLLEDIKKEQSIQKALEIAEEMEEMQASLNEKTENQEASDQKLAEQQQTIADKLDSLQEQLDKAEDLMDEQKDSDLMQAMEELREQMQQDSLSSDLMQSMENLQKGDMQKAQQSQQSAQQKMQKMTQKLKQMQQMMAACSMMEMGDNIQKAISRLLIFSQLHEKSSYKFLSDPFLILPDQIAIFEGINLTLKELFKTPMIILAVGPKFLYDTNFTTSSYHELFQYINDAKKGKVKDYLKDIQKGINLMIYDLMQASSNMQQGGCSSGMQSLMQALQQMGQQQLAMNMMTQQLMMQMSQDGKMSQEARAQAQRLARDEERLAENLKRILQSNRDAQNQTSALNKIINDLESIAHDLKRGRIDQNLIDKQERILSRLLDAQKSIHKREFSKKRKAELSDIEDWELPEEIKLKFDKMRKKALLNEDYKEFPKEYQELIREYLRLLNEKAE
jgi:DNA repair exonuclease SbcCD ATPase subunit